MNFCERCGAYLAYPPAAPYSLRSYYAPPPGIRLAGFWIRLAAFLLDLILVLLPTFAVLFGALLLIPLTLPEPASEIVFILILLLFPLTFLSYFTLMTYFHGATVGKKLMKLKVISLYGQPMTFGKAALRETVGRYISSFLCYLGYFWVIFDPYNRAWHDHLAKTLVIYG